MQIQTLFLKFLNIPIMLVSKPSERVIRAMFTTSLFLISMKPPITYLRFYQIDYSLKRKRLLKSYNFEIRSLRQLDSKRGLVILSKDGLFQVWDLSTESILFSCIDTHVWYSKGKVVQSVQLDNSIRLQITDLNTNTSETLILNDVSHIFLLSL